MNLAQRTYALLAVVALLMGALLAAAMTAQGTDGPPADDSNYQEEAVKRLFDENGEMVTTDDRLAKIAQEQEGGSNYQEEAVKRLLDKDGNIVTTDDRLAKIAREQEGGFGGYYFDEKDPGQAYVFMKDPSKAEAARTAFQLAHSGGQRTITEITPVRGDYAFNDLLTWYKALRRKMAENNTNMSSGAVMEIRNRIVMGLPDMTKVDDIRRLMRDLAIPEGAVVFEESQVELFAD